MGDLNTDNINKIPESLKIIYGNLMIRRETKLKENLKVYGNIEFCEDYKYEESKHDGIYEDYFDPEEQS